MKRVRYSLAAAAAAAAVAIFDFRNIFLLAISLILIAAAAAFAFYAAKEADVAVGGAEMDRGELKGILAAMDDALIFYDSDFKVLFYNNAAERLFRLKPAEVMGHKLAPQDVEQPGWQTLIQVVFPSLAPRTVPRSREGVYPQITDISFTEPEELSLRVTTAPVPGSDGKSVGFMKIIRDRTAQLAALRARSDFVTIASHQLRGPLTDISWALQSLASAPELSETNRLIVQNASAASQGAVNRIESLINISKMDEGKFGYQFAPDDPVEFVGKVLADVLPAARKAGVKIYFDRPASPLAKVMIDPQRLSVALVDILENAIRYNVANGEVVVKVDAVPGKPFVEISAKDTGIGVPPEDIGKLFTKFYRAENAMKSQTEGSGLGLYIAKSIVQAHGGEIWVESELSRGTTVHFTLPTDPNLVPKREMAADDPG